MTEQSSFNFASIGLSPSSLKILSRAGFVNPTPIQAKAIPHGLAGRDLIGCAATGTGKTAAFLLPMIERLASGKGTKAIILAPTRELAIQIAEQLDVFSRGKIRGAVIVGGLSMFQQARALKEGREVIIATPGRLVDHLERRTVRLDKIEVLVLDEADRMLDMGFRPQLEKILASLPKARQTMLFSATMAGEVAQFAGKHLNNPQRVEIVRSGTVAARAAQRVFHVSQEEKVAMLCSLLEEDQETTLVFTRTKHRADRLFKTLSLAGHESARIHADRTQGQRRQALDGFREGKFRILVATDIVSRGLDVEQIGHVVNYDLPHVPEDYVHRVGRTARASASGKASSFCSPEEKPLLKGIEKFTRQVIPQGDVPRGSETFQERMTQKRSWQANPGPKQPGHGISGRPVDKEPGRHARTHRKKHQTVGFSPSKRSERIEKPERNVRSLGEDSSESGQQFRKDRKKSKSGMAPRSGERHFSGGRRRGSSKTDGSPALAPKRHRNGEKRLETAYRSLSREKVLATHESAPKKRRRPVRMAG